MTQGTSGQGWFPDPSGRHEYRFFDGRGWTTLVSDQGVASYDVGGQQPGPGQAEHPAPAPAQQVPAPQAPPQPTPPPVRPAQPAVQPAAQQPVILPLPGGGQPPNWQQPPGGGQPAWAGAAATPPTPPAKRGKARWAIPLVVGVVLIALIAGLFGWRTYSNRAPSTPAEVATKAVSGHEIGISWQAPSGGPEVEQYLVKRDGEQVASLPGTTTTYTDSDELDPGETYEYEVVAVAHGKESAPTEVAEARTLAPVPGKFKSKEESPDSVILAWSKPAGAAQPDKYVIYRNGEPVDEVDGAKTTFEDSGLAPGTAYKYTIVGKWGDRESEKAEEIKVRTTTPAKAEARLAGAWTMQMKMVSSGGGDWPKPGKTWNEDWTFDPKCKAGACDVVVSADVIPEGFAPEPFKITLKRDGGTYSGSKQTHITNCQSKPVKNVVVMKLKVKQAEVQQGTWVATAVTGSVVIKSPYTSASGGYYCPAQSVTTGTAGQRVG